MTTQEIKNKANEIDILVETLLETVNIDTEEYFNLWEIKNFTKPIKELSDMINKTLKKE